jgi:hypothetical protein
MSAGPEIVKGRQGRRGNPAAGRAKGTPNKVTADARRAIAMFVDNNAHRLEGWLDQVAQENPAKAFEMFQSVVEYHVPKLQRTEVTGPDGGPLQVTVNRLA